MEDEETSPQRKKRRQRLTIHDDDEEDEEEVYDVRSIHSSSDGDEDMAAEVSLNALKDRILGRPLLSREEDCSSSRGNNDDALHDSQGNPWQRSSQVTPADLRRSLTCVICHELLYEPVAAPCGHSFCRGCLAWWWKMQEPGNDSSTPSVPCPTCRRLLPGHDFDKDYQVHTVLRDVVQFHFPHEVRQRRAADDIKQQQATAGEDGGTHARGYQVLETQHVMVQAEAASLSLAAPSTTLQQSYPVTRTIVMDAHDQRMQLAFALYQEHPQTTPVVDYNPQDRQLVLTLALLTMEEDEVADSGFPLVVQAQSDQEHLIVGHQHHEGEHTGVPVEVTLETAANSTTDPPQQQPRQLRQGHDMSQEVRPLARRNLGSDGTLSLVLDALPTTGDAAVMVIVFRHTETNVELRLQLPSRSANDNSALSHASHAQPIPRQRPVGQRYRAYHDESDENDQEEDEFEDDGFIVPDGDDDDSGQDATEICQVCLDGGDLMVCDGGRHTPGCGHLFHAECVERDGIPEGDWICQECAEAYGIDNPGPRGHEFPGECNGKKIDGHADHDPNRDDNGDDDHDNSAAFSPLAEEDEASQDNSRAAEAAFSPLADEEETSHDDHHDDNDINNTAAFSPLVDEAEDAVSDRHARGRTKGTTSNDNTLYHGNSRSACRPSDHPSDDSYSGTLPDLVQRQAPITLFDPHASKIRFALMIAYDGDPFHGLAVDPQEPNTIQAWVEGKLASMIGRTDGQCPVTRHGRTDAGVHSCGTVLHVDFTAEEVARLARRRASETDPSMPTSAAQVAARVLRDTLVRGIGSGHTKHIQVHAVYPVSMDCFHARRSSVGKVYRYFVHTGHPMPWVARRCWSLHGRSLDVDAMCQVAENILVGVHDCSVFVRDKKPRQVDYRSPIRHVVSILIEPDEFDPEMIGISVHCDFFLTNMCRRMVGLLVQVGLGKVSPEEVADTLGTGFRHPPPALHNRFLVTAPPQGLCLSHVLYDSNGQGRDPTRPAALL